MQQHIEEAAGTSARRKGKMSGKRMIQKSHTELVQAFAVHAPREWNLIPYEIQKSNIISSFKKNIT